MSVQLIILVVALIIIIAILLRPKRPSVNPEVTPQEREFARSLGYQIESPSTITYQGLGRMGRLGNQLFEIAATVEVAKENRCRVIFPESIKRLPLYELFDLQLPLRPDHEIQSEVNCPEMSNFDQILIPPDGRTYSLEGYRQSIKYLKPIWKQLRTLFPLKKKREESIGIHIRRTDCIKTNPIRRFFDSPLNCSLEYYREAIKRLRRIHHLPKEYPVVVATDDRAWAEEHLSEIDPAAVLSRGGSLKDDFLTLASSKYLVISNSTFSLWAAFLGPQKKDRIVAPSLWFAPDNKLVRLLGSQRQHFCPPDWLFQEPVTGESVKEAYHWEDDQPGPFRRAVRSLLMSNRFRR